MCKLIDLLNYENGFKINRYESSFFIDKIWNDIAIQGEIWNGKFVSVNSKVENFKRKRAKKKADDMAKSLFSNLSNLQMMEKPMRLKDELDPLEQKKIESHRNLVYTMRCT